MAPALLLLLLGAGASDALDAGTRLLEEFRTDEALTKLLLAEKQGPYVFEDKVRLHEQLGIAYAYLDRPKEARAHFGFVLMLDRGHFISYTLSPKVTFLFEQARQEAENALPLMADVSWPRGLSVESTVPVDLEIVSDPQDLLVRAQLNYRLRGDSTFQSVELAVETTGLPSRVDLPPLAKGRDRDSTIEIYLSLFDARGNELLRWGSEKRPREIQLIFDPGDPWYESWWVWTLVGGAVAAGTGLGVFFVTQEPSDNIRSTFEVGR
jgi:hypothetical protein